MATRDTTQIHPVPWSVFGTYLDYRSKCRYNPSVRHPLHDQLSFRIRADPCISWKVVNRVVLSKMERNFLYSTPVGYWMFLTYPRRPSSSSAVARDEDSKRHHYHQGNMLQKHPIQRPPSDVSDQDDLLVIAVVASSFYSFSFLSLPFVCDRATGIAAPIQLYQVFVRFNDSLLTFYLTNPLVVCWPTIAKSPMQGHNQCAGCGGGLLCSPFQS